MPSAQFYLEVEEKDVCTLNPKTSVATGSEMGSTEIKLMDKSILLAKTNCVITIPGILLFYSKYICISGRFSLLRIKIRLILDYLYCRIELSARGYQYMYTVNMATVFLKF